MSIWKRKNVSFALHSVDLSSLSPVKSCLDRSLRTHADVFPAVAWIRIQATAGNTSVFVDLTLTV